MSEQIQWTQEPVPASGWYWVADWDFSNMAPYKCSPMESPWRGCAGGWRSVSPITPPAFTPPSQGRKAEPERPGNPEFVCQACGRGWAAERDTCESCGCGFYEVQSRLDWDFRMRFGFEPIEFKDGGGCSSARARCKSANALWWRALHLEREVARLRGELLEETARLNEAQIKLSECGTSRLHALGERDAALKRAEAAEAKVAELRPATLPCFLCGEAANVADQFCPGCRAVVCEKCDTTELDELFGHTLPEAHRAKALSLESLDARLSALESAHARASSEADKDRAR